MKFKIIFDSQTGTTEYVAEVMQKQLIEMGHTVDLHSIRYNGSNPDLGGYDALLFGAPTYEDGKLETAMKVFITKFSADFSQYKIGVFGLGNSSFPQFCTSAKILSEWVEQNKGTLVIPALKIDGFPDDLAPIEKWIAQFDAAIK